MSKIEAFLRNSVRSLLSKLSTQTCKRILSNATLHHEYNLSICQAPQFEDIHGTWDFALDLIGKDELITYLEFGVFSGRSIKYISSESLNKESIFLGLDTFEGLPEDWDTQGGNLPKGHFSVEGKLPDIKDTRIKFIKGLFQETSSEWMDILLNRKDQILLAHFDADLYSSTLFGLSQIANTGKPFYCIFDEFYGDECRAFSDFKSSFRYECKLLCSGARCYENGAVTQRNILAFVTPLP